MINKTVIYKDGSIKDITSHYSPPHDGVVASNEFPLNDPHKTPGRNTEPENSRAAISPDPSHTPDDISFRDTAYEPESLNEPMSSHISAVEPLLMPDDEVPFLPGVYRTILTPEGFIPCLNKGYIDEMSFDKAAVDDKEKANIIAKIFAFSQAMWLVVQALARWRSSPVLPLTLLEVHVLLQVACTAFTYLHW